MKKRYLYFIYAGLFCIAFILFIGFAQVACQVVSDKFRVFSNCLQKPKDSFFTVLFPWQKSMQNSRSLSEKALNACGRQILFCTSLFVSRVATAMLFSHASFRIIFARPRLFKTSPTGS